MSGNLPCRQVQPWGPLPQLLRPCHQPAMQHFRQLHRQLLQRRTWTATQQQMHPASGNLRVKHDQERAAHDQLASLSPELLAAAVMVLENGNKHVRQLAARSAHDVEAGTVHPASHVEPLTQLKSHEGWSKKRREPACFGGVANKRRGQQQ